MSKWTDKGPTYSSWHNARKRCYCVTHERYPVYGGVGVVMADRWAKYENFLADMGERPSGTSLGRFNDTGNYESGNVAWMTQAEQLANRKVKA